MKKILLRGAIHASCIFARSEGINDALAAVDSCLPARINFRPAPGVHRYTSEICRSSSSSCHCRVALLYIFYLRAPMRVRLRVCFFFNRFSVLSFKRPLFSSIQPILFYFDSMSVRRTTVSVPLVSLANARAYICIFFDYKMSDSFEWKSPRELSAQPRQNICIQRWQPATRTRVLTCARGCKREGGTIKRDIFRSMMSRLFIAFNLNVKICRYISPDSEV